MKHIFWRFYRWEGDMRKFIDLRHCGVLDYHQGLCLKHVCGALFWELRA